MALRRTIAERIAPLKKRLAIETPILEEIPSRAELLASVEFPFPRVRGIIPVLVHGRAYGETAGMWYRVTFPRPVSDPSVVCVGEARRGEVPIPTLPTISVRPVEEIPALTVLAVEKIPPLEKVLPVEKIAALEKVLKEKIPDLTIPPISINVPKWAMVVPTAGDFVALVKRFFGDWGWLNWVRDAIAWAIGNFEYSIWDALFRPRALERLNSEVLTPIRDSFVSVRDNINAKIAEINDRLDKVRTNLNIKLGEIDGRLETLRTGVNDRLMRVGSGVDGRFETLRTGVNDRFASVGVGVGERFETLRTRTSDRLETLRDNTETSVNDVLATLFPRLYDAWGFPRNMALTPLHIRNVNSTGFEFQSYGQTTCYYIAIGTRM